MKFLSEILHPKNIYFHNRIVLITAGIFLLAVFTILTPFESVQPSPSYLSQVDSTGVIEDSSDIEEDIEEDLEDFEGDSTQVKIPRSVSISDSVLVDTTTYVLIDSSARVEHFVYQRKDIPYVNPFVKKPHPLFLENRSTAYQANVKLDSTGKYVTLSETIYDHDVKIPIVIPIEEYIQQRLEFERYKSWNALSKVYTEKEKGVGLGELFGSITNIDIPVPSVPFLSIFGPPKINLRISGAVDIRAGFRSQKSDQATISYQDKVRNEPNFNQEVQINVNGTIGDKLNILADWNTQRTFEYENQLKLKYTGYEDEVIQSIEAGNVSLQSPAAFMGSSAALFGIKGRFQFGPLSLQTVLSQKKGQTRELTAAGGAQERPIMIRALDYSTNHFFLDTIYRNIFETIYSTISAQLPMNMIQYEVVEIEVWKTRQGSILQPGEKEGVAFINLPPISPQQQYPESYREAVSISGEIEKTRWIKLQQSDYKLNRKAGYISISTSLQDDQALAVAFRTVGLGGSPDDDFMFGEFAGGDTSSRPIILKLVRPRNLIPGYKVAWNMMLKNIYSVGGTNLKKEGFQINIFRESGSESDRDVLLGENLLRILQVDKYDENNSPTPDGKFDYYPGYTVDEARGEIIFPSLEPFRKSITDFLRSKNEPQSVIDSLTFPEIYDTTRYFASQSMRNKYVIKGKSSTASKNSYDLGFNIVEGSVQVLLDGTPLVPQADYTVDYMIGQVVIRNQRALVPGANLQIKYEQNDLFQLASKTMIGARGEIDPLPNTKLGFTIMNLNQETLSDKVRLNEEPTNNTMFGVDGMTSVDLGFLTDVVDALPLLKTREMSNFKISGEAAYMLPDPNTKKSPIASDKGSGIAYIDDFEGARRTIPLGISYTTWKLGSPPLYSSLGNVHDTIKTFSRAKLMWYNRLPSDVLVTHIWPNRSYRKGQELVTVMNLDYFPKQRGPYNYSLDIESTLLAQPSKNWTGIMKFLGGTGANILEQNINYIEIWMKAESISGQAQPNLQRGRLYVNLGKISEDVIPNKKLNSEDIIKGNYPNGILNPGEDVGLDMLTDEQERVAYSALITKYPELNSDPSGDNWAYLTGTQDFSKINGTEQNEISAEGRFPDTEDLNANGDVDLINSYLEYEIPLAMKYIDSLGIERDTNHYIVGGGTMGWHQFRIPLTEFTRKLTTGNEQPTDILQNVQYVRLWISGFDEPVRVRIADIGLVGNQWQEVTKTDTILKVTVVNIEDNPEYHSPPGVIRERDRTQPDQEILGNEQSLNLKINGLADGQSREAVKNYPRGLDVFNYKTMKMFVHGDNKFNYTDTSNYDAEIYLRFGYDSLNYYEYRAPIHPGWDPPNNEIVINFADLSAVKEGRDSIRTRSRPVPVKEGPTGAVYTVLGNPALTNIRFIWVGIENPINKGNINELHGEVWVNELRVADVDDTPGWAYRFNTQLKIADFGNASFNMERVDPFFHGLDQRFGRRETGLNWAVNANFALEKFFPSSWQGTSLPFTYTHTENIVNPLYLPNTDIKVDQAAQRASEAILQRGGTQAQADSIKKQIISEVQTIRTSDAYAVPSLRIALPSDAWYIRETINKLGWSFSYNRSTERNPMIAERVSWAWRGGGNYAVSLPTDFYFAPFGKIFDGVYLLDDFKNYKIFFLPITGFNTSISAQRGQTREVARVQSALRPITRNFSASRSLSFGWKLTEGGLTNISGDYSLNIESILMHLETDSAGNQRPIKQILRDIFSTNKIINFGRDARYGQRLQINSKPKIPNILDINKYLDFTLSYGVNYGWQDNFQQGDIGKSAGFDNNFNFSTNFRLKALTDPWFVLKAEPTKSDRFPVGGFRPQQKENLKDADLETSLSDTTTSVLKDSIPTQKSGINIIAQLKTLAKIFIKYPVLDYETINITYNQTNRAGHSGVRGSTGLMNMWGVAPWADPNPDYGPSRLYQFGIISDPSGSLHYKSKSGFPFFKFDLQRGLRAANANLSDQYNQTNRVQLRTSRPLWEGATLDLNWNLSWTFNKNTTLITDAEGVPTITSVAVGGSVERSFFSLPPVLLFKMLKSNLEEVGKIYNARRIDASDTAPDDVKLAESFETGMEALPFLRKIIGPLAPRVNYSLRWDGLEKTLSMTSIFDRVSLDHSYISGFTKQWRGNPNGGERTEAERINYGFTPLLGINATVKEFWKGNLSTTLRYNTNSSYDLNLAARNILGTLTQEMSVSLSYARRGFEIPLFGLSLSNDIDFSATYSLAHNSRTTYEVNQLETNPKGTPLEGTTRTMFEPRLKYVLSSRVTASVYYRYTKIAPDEGGSLIPGTTTNEGGLDLRIAIQ